MSSPHKTLFFKMALFSALNVFILTQNACLLCVFLQEVGLVDATLKEVIVLGDSLIKT